MKLSIQGAQKKNSYHEWNIEIGANAINLSSQRNIKFMEKHNKYFIMLYVHKLLLYC